MPQKIWLHTHVHRSQSKTHAPESAQATVYLKYASGLFSLGSVSYNCISHSLLKCIDTEAGMK